ncbi:unnamed protein product [Vitrella brassicaformis CCMP3155]|uniref:Uncharacterized protein n=1 Tax=Vitrella brassicaformis (strain CCMP3155) TaxID=1169540 RepID=A0A0G4F1M4_VITBC|nr:unnamed protein product [Vitrella brassicaformis CCMP3155]|eukprot:CEM05629.1 unnamed protein product [Vitrella brassicaformis CCMP3155]
MSRPTRNWKSCSFLVFIALQVGSAAAALHDAQTSLKSLVDDGEERARVQVASGGQLTADCVAFSVNAEVLTLVVGEDQSPLQWRDADNRLVFVSENHPPKKITKVDAALGSSVWLEFGPGAYFAMPPGPHRCFQLLEAPTMSFSLAFFLSSSSIWDDSSPQVLLDAGNGIQIGFMSAPNDPDMVLFGIIGSRAALVCWKDREGAVYHVTVSNGQLEIHRWGVQVLKPTRLALSLLRR